MFLENIFGSVNQKQLIQQQTDRFYTRALVENTSIVDTDQERSFWVVFATENPVFRKGWEESFNEVLLCKPENMRSTRLNEGAVPLLNNHNQCDGIEGQMGRVVEYSLENGRCLARVLFSTQEKFSGIWEDIKAGVIRSVSTGYNVYKYLREMATDNTIPDYKAIVWEPLEISLSPVPADFKSQVGRSGIAQHEIIIENFLPAKNVRSDMKTDKQTESTGNIINELHIRSEAIKAERQRSMEITNAVRAARLPDAFGQQLLQDGTSVNEARSLIINELAKTGSRATSTSMYTSISVDETDKTRTAIIEAIMHRAQPGAIKLEDKSQDYKYATLTEIARRCLDMKGERSGRFGPSELITRAFATTDFPLILGGTVDRFLRKFYDAQNFDWKNLASQISAPDFRERTGVAASGKVTFEEIAEGGQYKNTMLLTEEAATVKLKTFGRKITITRQSIINDDLGVFNYLPKIIAMGAANFQADKIWGLITSNAKTPDNKTLFHADHGNLAAGATKAAPSITTLSAARAAMWRQTTPAGESMPVPPKFLVVPAELQTVGEQLMTSIMANTSSTVNVFASRYDIVVDPRLTDVNAWYMVADPEYIQGLVYAYLQGEGLHVENQVDFDNDAVVTKARLDFDCNIWDYRGWYKNPGI
jgi:hypothetical protein